MQDEVASVGVGEGKGVVGEVVRPEPAVGAEEEVGEGECIVGHVAAVGEGTGMGFDKVVVGVADVGAGEGVEFRLRDVGEVGGPGDGVGGDGQAVAFEEGVLEGEDVGGHGNAAGRAGGDGDAEFLFGQEEELGGIHEGGAVFPDGGAGIGQARVGDGVPAQAGFDPLEGVKRGVGGMVGDHKVAGFGA